jgi:hypothetical protein
MHQLASDIERYGPLLKAGHPLEPAPASAIPPAGGEIILRAVCRNRGRTPGTFRRIDARRRYGYRSRHEGS